MVGDLHGQLVDLAAVFEAAGGAPSHSNRYIFNGDFIDRGDAGVEVLAVLLSYALALPGSVHLNRGNHEDRLLCQAYSFRSELEEKYPDEASELFKDVVAVFQALPLAATIREPEPEPEQRQQHQQQQQQQQQQRGDGTASTLSEGIVVVITLFN